MLFLLLIIPVGLISAYMTFICARQKYTGAALLMGSVTAVCVILALIIIAAALFVSQTV